MSTARWFSSLVRLQPDLYRAIYDWNSYPSRWALAEHRPNVDLPEPVLRLLSSTPSGRVRLSRYDQKRFGLEDTWWDFAPVPRRLALLSGPTLQALARFSGATLQWQRLALAVTRDDRKAIIDAIHDDAYTFALRQGRSLLSASQKEILQSSLEGEVLPLATGWRLLGLALASEPIALRRRVALKVPKGVVLFPSAPVSADVSAQAATFLLSLLNQVLSPAERPCFA